MNFRKRFLWPISSSMYRLCTVQIRHRFVYKHPVLPFMIQKQLLRITGVVLPLVFFFHCGLAQQETTKTDSLKHLFSQSRTDSARAMALIHLAIEYRFVNVDSAQAYKRQVAQLAGNNLYVNGHLQILKATLLRDAAQYDKALKEVEPMIPKLLAHKEYQVAALSHRAIANIYQHQGEYSRAIQNHLKSIEYGNKIHDKSFVGHACLNMAFVYYDIKEYHKAIELYQQALAVFSEIHDEPNRIAAYNNLSGAYCEVQQYKKAVKYAEKVLDYFEQTGQNRYKSYPLVNLGRAYSGLKRYALAEQYLKKAIAIKEANKDYKDMVISQSYLTELYLTQNKLKEAEQVALEGYRLAKKKNMLPQLMNSSEQLAFIYKETKDYKQASHFFEINKILKDSLSVTEKAKEMFRLQTRYETAEKEKQILQQQAKIANRNFWIFGLTALATIVGLTGFLRYKQQVLKNTRQQRENELQLALEKIEHQNRLQKQRLAISRDLHDNIGAQLAFIVSAIDTTRYYITAPNERLTRRLDSIGVFAKETIQELRDTIWAMNKQDITIHDLQSRIANFMEKAKQAQHNIQITFTAAENMPADLTFTALQGLNIFRIIQEATSNALKYAEAHHIQIHISGTENSIQFLIADDGKGFLENETEAGNGLLNMRKRALELNSELQLVSEPNKGTSIAFNISKH